MKILPLLLFTILISCGTTAIVSSWHEPGTEITISNLNKVLVVALFKTQTSQRKAEDQMVGFLKGKGIQSYNYFTASFNKNNEQAMRNKIKKDGFDGAITMRLIDVDQEKTYNPADASIYPIYYREFTGYYLNRWAYNTTPGYYTTTKIYTVETNVYSIKTDKIIWSCLTESTNPNGVKTMTDEVAKIVYKQMIKEGFIIN